jgi:hypothetical protein
MAVYIITGKLGGGKSLAAVGRAVHYATMGRRVVANFHLDISSCAHRRDSLLAKATVEVINDRPTAAELLQLGRGGKGEHDAGLLILDECGTFLNARQWAGTERQELIDWFLHSRKFAWDVILIVQHASMLDKQIREAIGEHLVTVRRMDKMNIPLVSWIFPVKMPQVHIATVKYGLGPGDMTVDRWIFRGKNLYQCYSTEWISGQDSRGGYCTLSAELVRFRYERKFDWSFAFSLVWRLPLYAVCLLFESIGWLRRSDFLSVRRPVAVSSR